jgi:hypothetical protein
MVSPTWRCPTPCMVSQWAPPNLQQARVSTVTFRQKIQGYYSAVDSVYLQALGHL